jgi:hypothetical protein
MLVVLAVVSRPEGLVWGAVFIAVEVVSTILRGKSWAEALVKAIPLVIAYAVTEAVLTLWRLWYFGYPLPNTYYAKVSSSISITLRDGISYFQQFISWHGVPFLVLPFLVSVYCATLLARATLDRASVDEPLRFGVIVAIFLATTATIPVLEGGDHFRGFRFFQPMIPFVALSSVSLLLLVRPGSVRKQTLTAAVVLAGSSLNSRATWTDFIEANSSSHYAVHEQRVIDEFLIAEADRNKGTELNSFFGILGKARLPRVGNAAAGGIAYTYDGPIIDVMGLNNTRFAHASPVKLGPKGHQSFSREAFYSEAPDILLPQIAAHPWHVDLGSVGEYYRNASSWDNKIFKGLFNDGDFNALYGLSLVSRPNGAAVYGYFRRDYLDRLRQLGLFTILIEHWHG